MNKNNKNKAIQAQEQKASKRGSKKDAINEKKVEKKDSFYGEESLLNIEIVNSKWVDVSKILATHSFMKRLNPIKIGISLDYIYILVNHKQREEFTKLQTGNLSKASDVIESIKINHPRFDLDQVIFNYNRKWMSYKEIRNFKQIDHVKAMKLKNLGKIIWNMDDKKLSL